MDQSSVEVEVVRSYGGSDATTPSFNRARYVYYFSVHEPFDLKDIIRPEEVITYDSQFSYDGEDEGNYVKCGYWQNGYSMSTTTTTVVTTTSVPKLYLDPVNPLPDKAAIRQSSDQSVGFRFSLSQPVSIDRIGLFYPPAASTPLLYWPNDPSSTAQKLGYPATIGYDFVVTHPQTIDRLGLVCFSSSLNTSHKITLWNDAGNVITSVTMPSGPCSPVDSFCWISIPGGPITIQPGRYKIAAFYPVDQSGLSGDAFAELDYSNASVSNILYGQLGSFDLYSEEIIDGSYYSEGLDSIISYVGTGDVRPTEGEFSDIYVRANPRRIGPNLGFVSSGGFSETHKISLWKINQNSQPRLLSVTTPSGTYAAIDGFYWTDVPGAPVLLEPGTYAVSADYSIDETNGLFYDLPAAKDPTRVYNQLGSLGPSGRVLANQLANQSTYTYSYYGQVDSLPLYLDSGHFEIGPNISFLVTTTTVQVVNRPEACVPLRVERRIPPALRAALSGLVGAERGTQTLFFTFRTHKPARIGLLLVRGQRYEDQYIDVSLHDDSGVIPIGIDGFARSTLEYPLEFERVTQVGLELGYVTCGYWQTDYAFNDCVSFSTKRIEEDAYGDLDYEFDSPYGGIMPPGRYGFTVSSSQWPKLPYKLMLAIIPVGELSALLECKSDPQARIGLAPLGGVVEMRSDVSGVVAGRLSVAAGVVEMTAAPTAMIERVSPYGP